MTKPELVMVPIPAVGHLPPVVEFSKHLTARNSQLSVTIVLLRTLSPEIDSFVDRLAESCQDLEAIHFIRISKPNFPPVDSYNVHSFFPKFLDSQTEAVKQALAARYAGVSSVSLAGFVVDMLTTAMVELGNELGVPSYLFFPSCAALLAQFLHFPVMGYSPEVAAGDPDGEVVYPSFVHPVPNRILPALVLDGQGYQELIGHVRRYEEVDGILVNSFVGLESRAINILNEKVDGVRPVGMKSFPRVFPVGPVLNLKGYDAFGYTNSSSEKVMTWLDDQPPQSVVFICFGSLGSVSDTQLGEVAAAIEQARHVRFLWIVRKTSPGSNNSMPNDCEDYSPSSPALNVLGEGFLERTRGRVIVCGWLPQVTVLAHKAIGGFVSHCGWNSILESLWYRVPILAWPMYAEQQMNAFYMARELGLAVELRVDYRIWESVEEGEMVVKGDEIARKIEMVMDEESEVRKKVKEMSELGRRALDEGGSSFDAIDEFIDLVLKNKPMV
ncbi:UDP-glycosyltransferase 71K2 [Linum grandiflorum]